MPLKKSASKAAFKSNLKAELSAGKGKAQSLAIAYSEQRAAKKKKRKMKKLAFILCLLSGPALADEPAKPTLSLMAIQLKATTLNLTYPTREACEASAKAATAHMKKHGLGRADCLPVVQP